MAKNTHGTSRRETPISQPQAQAEEREKESAEEQPKTDAAPEKTGSVKERRAARQAEKKEKLSKGEI